MKLVNFNDLLYNLVLRDKNAKEEVEMLYCPNCGNEIPEGSDVQFCGACGFRFQEGAAPVAPEAQENQSDEGDMLEKGKQLVGNVAEAAKNVDVNDLIAKAKAGDKKVIGIAAAAAVVVIGLVVLFVFLIFGKGYMSPVEDYMKAINKMNTDYFEVGNTLKGKKIAKADAKIRKLLVEAGAELYGDSMEERYEEYNEDMEDMYDEVLDEYDKFKVTFEKKSAKKMDKDDREDGAEALSDYYEDMLDTYEDQLDDDDEIEEFADMYDIDEEDAEKLLKAYADNCKRFVDCKISAGYEVKGKFIVTVDGKDEYETDSVKLILVKLNGEWVYAGCDSSLWLDLDGDEEAEVLDDLLKGLRNGGLY